MCGDTFRNWTYHELVPPWPFPPCFVKILLDRLGSGKDLAAFLQTPSGERLIGSLVDTNSPQRATLRSVRSGVVIIFVSVALLLVGGFAREGFFAAIGMVLLFLGAGLLVAARVTDRLAKRMGEP